MLKNFVVIGGGFAGTKVTRELEHTLPPDWTLTLVSQENFITFNPLLPEVVGASILPGHVIAPHRQMIHCSHVCMAQVSEIDTVKEGVWAAGDCAGAVNAWDGKPCPPTAQFADAQAKQLATNIIARLKGLPTQPFRFRPRGQLSSVGHNKAVAEVMGLEISGFVAWLMWRGLYLLRIPTLARKSRLFLEWNWAMFFPTRHIPLWIQAQSAAQPTCAAVEGSAFAGAAARGCANGSEARRARQPAAELLQNIHKIQRSNVHV